MYQISDLDQSFRAYWLILKCLLLPHSAIYFHIYVSCTLGIRRAACVGRSRYSRPVSSNSNYDTSASFHSNYKQLKIKLKECLIIAVSSIVLYIPTTNYTWTCIQYRQHDTIMMFKLDEVQCTAMYPDGPFQNLYDAGNHTLFLLRSVEVCFIRILSTTWNMKLTEALSYYQFYVAWTFCVAGNLFLTVL